MTISANDEAIEAWDGVLFDRFAQFRDVILPGLGVHSDRALTSHPPAAGERGGHGGVSPLCSYTTVIRSRRSDK